MAARAFAVLEHTLASGEVHYDLCLDCAPEPAAAGSDERTLATCQLEGPPDPSGAVRGQRSFDHRRLYLGFEGELSGGRGRVRLWDRGTARDLEAEPRAARYAFRAEGARLQGEFLLTGAPGEGSPVLLAPRSA